MVTPDFAVGTWMSEWSSKNSIQPFIDDLRKVFPIRISEIDTLEDKLSFLERLPFRRNSVAKGIRFKFLTCRGERTTRNKNRVILCFKENIKQYINIHLFYVAQIYTIIRYVINLFSVIKLKCKLFFVYSFFDFLYNPRR